MGGWVFGLVALEALVVEGGLNNLLDQVCAAPHVGGRVGGPSTRRKMHNTALDQLPEDLPEGIGVTSVEHRQQAPTVGSKTEVHVSLQVPVVSMVSGIVCPVGRFDVLSKYMLELWSGGWRARGEPRQTQCQRVGRRWACRAATHKV